MALGGEEGEAHAAADEQSVDPGQKVLDHSELVADLRPPEDDGVRPLGVCEHRREHRDLGPHEVARVAGQEPGDVGNAGLLAVHDPESVADESVGEGGPLCGQGLALSGVLAGLARVEPHVLEHGHVAVLHAADHLTRRRPTDVAGETHRSPQELGQPCGGRGERKGGVRRPPGSSEVRQHHHPRPRVAEPADGADAGPDSTVVGDHGRATLVRAERHVQVAAHENRATGRLEVVEGPHQPAAAT